MTGTLPAGALPSGTLPNGALVVLTHGLWLNRQALFVWRHHFEHHGVAVATFGYPSREPLADNSERLAAFIAEQTAEKIYLLGHSLGGLVILGLARLGSRPLRVARAVIAGTPVAGSEAGRRFARWHYGRWLIAGAAPVLDQADQTAWLGDAAPFEVGVIAGTRGIGLGSLLGRLPAPHDGTIPVAETRFSGARDAIMLPLSHSQMLLSGELVQQSLGFFSTGHFSHGAPAS